MGVIFSLITTLLIFFIVPIVVYGLFSRFYGLKEPEKKKEFFIGVLIQKIGTSLGFVLLYYLGIGYFGEHWLLYSFVWVLMFIITEIGQMYMPNYSKKEAAAGIISEIIYFPLAGAVMHFLLR